MLVISQKRSSCNSFRPNSHLHIYSKATDMKPDWNVLIGLVADQQKEMNRYTIQEKRAQLIEGSSLCYYHLSVIAIASISTNASFGSRATSTHERAGGLSIPNTSSYTSLKAIKLFISDKKHVVFITFSKLEPLSSNIALRFSNDCFVCFFDTTRYK